MKKIFLLALAGVFLVGCSATAGRRVEQNKLQFIKMDKIANALGELAQWIIGGGFF